MDQKIRELYDLTTTGALPFWKFREEVMSLIEKEQAEFSEILAYLLQPAEA